MTELQRLAQVAWAAEEFPAQWLQGDDACDCTFQRIGEWGNPYLGKSLQIRLCCVWAELAKQFPQFVQEVTVFWDRNKQAPTVGPQPWDSEEMDMPLDLWYRQLSAEQGRPLADIREEYSHKLHLRPRKVRPGTGRESKQPEPYQIRMALLDRLERTGWRREDAIAQFEKQDREARDAKGR